MSWPIVASFGIAIALLVGLLFLPAKQGVLTWSERRFLLRKGVTPEQVRSLVAYKVDPREILLTLRRLRRYGVAIDAGKVVAHYQLGRSVVPITNAVLLARQQGLDMTWDELASIDASGDDPFEAVQKVIGNDD